MGPPSPPPPSPEEARRIRSKAASDLLSLIPNNVARKFFAVQSIGNRDGGSDDCDEGVAADEEMRREVEDRFLGWMEDAEMNKFLVYAILEHVLLRLIPEMAGKTPSELLADRGVSLTESSDLDLHLNGTYGDEKVGEEGR